MSIFAIYWLNETIKTPRAPIILGFCFLVALYVNFQIVLTIDGDHSINRRTKRTTHKEKNVRILAKRMNTRHVSRFAIVEPFKPICAQIMQNILIAIQVHPRQ